MAVPQYMMGQITSLDNRLLSGQLRNASSKLHMLHREHLVLNAKEEWNQLQVKFALLSTNETNGVCLCRTFHSKWSSALQALIISPITELQIPLGWNINSCLVEHSSKPEQLMKEKHPFQLQDQREFC